MEKNTHQFTQFNAYADTHLFVSARLIYKDGLIERPSNWESVRDSMLRAKEQKKKDTEKSFSSEICAAYAGSMKGEEDLKNNFDLIKFLEFAQNHRASMGVAPNEQLTDNERKIRNKVYKPENGKWVSRVEGDKKKVRDLNTKITERVTELENLTSKSGRSIAESQRMRVLNAEITALKTTRSRLEAKIEKVEGYVKTVQWMVYRHVAMRMSKQNLFRVQRAAEKPRVGTKGFEQKFAEQMTEYGETLGEMSPGRLIALAGFGMLALYMMKFLSPKVKEAFKFSAVSAIGFMLVNYGAVPLFAKNKTGLEVFANVLEDMKRTGGPLYLALRKNKNEKLSQFAKRAKPMSKALLLMQQNETPAKDVMKAYYEARRKATGKDKENGNITQAFPGIDMDGKELYGALHIIFSKYKAQDTKTGKWLVAINSKNYEKKTFAGWLVEKMGDDGSFSMEKSWAMRALRGGKKIATEIGKQFAKAIENAPHYLKKAYYQIINNKEIRKAFENGKISVGKVLAAVLKGAKTVAEIPGDLAGLIDSALKSYQGGNIGLFINEIFEKLHVINSVDKKQKAAFIIGAETAKKFSKAEEIADFIWKKYHKNSSPEIAYAFRSVATYLKKTQLNELASSETSEAYYVGVRVKMAGTTTNDRFKAMKLGQNIAINKIFKDTSKQFPELKYQREGIRKNLQLAYAGMVGTDEIHVFFRIRKPNASITKASDNKHIFIPKDYQESYEHMPSTMLYDKVLAPMFKTLISYPSNVGNVKMLQNVYGTALRRPVTTNGVLAILREVYLQYGDPKKLNEELVNRGVYKKKRDMYKQNREGMLNYFISLARRLAQDSKFIEKMRSKI